MVVMKYVARTWQASQHGPGRITPLPRIALRSPSGCRAGQTTRCIRPSVARDRQVQMGVHEQLCVPCDERSTRRDVLAIEYDRGARGLLSCETRLGLLSGCCGPLYTVGTLHAPHTVDYQSRPQPCIGTSANHCPSASSDNASIQASSNSYHGSFSDTPGILEENWQSYTMPISVTQRRGS